MSGFIIINGLEGKDIIYSTSIKDLFKPVEEIDHKSGPGWIEKLNYLLQ